MSAIFVCALQNWEILQRFYETTLETLKEARNEVRRERERERRRENVQMSVVEAADGTVGRCGCCLEVVVQNERQVGQLVVRDWRLFEAEQGEREIDLPGSDTWLIR